MEAKSIAEQLFFTTVRIDTITIDGDQSSGTGFLFAHTIGEHTFPFIVTNKHVVQNMKEGVLSFLQGHNELPTLGHGIRFKIDNWADVWFGHPKPDIDIAVAPFLPLQEHIKQKHNVDLFFRYVNSNLIPHQSRSLNWTRLRW